MNRNIRVLVPLSRALKQSLKNPYETPMRTFLVPHRAAFPLSHLDSTFKEMDRQFQKMEREMNSIFRDFARLPGISAAAQNQRQPIAVYDIEAPSDVIKPQVLEGEKENKYLLNIYMGENFSPDNIKMSLKDRVLTVEAKVEEKEENSRFYQEISKSFTLPEKVDLANLKSVLTPEGILRIEAPIPKDALPEANKPQEIAIDRV